MFEWLSNTDWFALCGNLFGLFITVGLIFMIGAIVIFDVSIIIHIILAMIDG